MELSKRIKEYWNKRSDEFCTLRISELNSIKKDLWLNEIKRNIEDIDNKKFKILDIGTGTGFFAIILSSLGHEVVGIDLCENMIDNANKTAKLLGYDINFKVMDAQNLDFEDNFFDIIISRNLTWTLPDAEEAYKEWYRVLKKDGRLVNFDADYGKVSFSEEAKTLDSNHAHNKIKNEVLKECDMIKDNLNISKKIRPNWDLTTLDKIGFLNCKSDINVSDRIYADKDELCNPTKMFSINASK
ncbi:class I SAM-dependent methyltransferase [Romboutsia ilealis]|uniref:class I SAM-dependent methyltransferase n=1 Tax=Romboutsia ilealis TaxID=1115758 RepID=UPI00259C6EB7|nr:class I SAM-dependent methyltransferase [Romboutsia ilealis]